MRIGRPAEATTVIEIASGLPYYAQAKLNSPRTVRLRADRSERGAGGADIRRRERNAIGRIEGLNTQLHVPLLRKREVLADGYIQVLTGIAPHVAELRIERPDVIGKLQRGRRDKSCYIEGESVRLVRLLVQRTSEIDHIAPRADDAARLHQHISVDLPPARQRVAQS